MQKYNVKTARGNVFVQGFWIGIFSGVFGALLMIARRGGPDSIL